MKAVHRKAFIFRIRLHHPKIENKQRHREETDKNAPLGQRAL